MYKKIILGCKSSIPSASRLAYISAGISASAGVSMIILFNEFDVVAKTTGK